MMRKVLVSLVVLLGFVACNSDDTYTTFSRYKASFAYSSVKTTIPLDHALNGIGEFCTIKLQMNGQILFATLNNSLPVNVSKDAYYQRFVCISGFIVGKPNTPENGKDELSLACFDLACSNCYHNLALNIDLQLRQYGMAYCRKCKRTYDLNNMGLVTSGDRGRPLERYHILYDNMNMMSITN